VTLAEEIHAATERLRELLTQRTHEPERWASAPPVELIAGARGLHADPTLIIRLESLLERESLRKAF
jgi:hypothetical protein